MSQLVRLEGKHSTQNAHCALEAVYIFFDMATYDQIERDIKVGNLY